MKPQDGALETQPAEVDPLTDSDVYREKTRIQLLRLFHETFQEAQDLQTVFQRLYVMLPKCLRVNRATVLLWDDASGGLVGEGAIGAAHPNEKLATGPQPVGFSISGLCFSEVRPIVINDCTTTDLIPKQFVEELRLKSAAAVPIVCKRAVIGVLRVDDTERLHRFNTEDIEFLTVVAEQLGVVIQNARLFEDLRRREREILRINRDLATAHDAAVEADQAKSAFLARVSHELRTPLNAILGYAELLQEDAVGPEEEPLREDLEKIHIAGRHLLRLIDDLLDLARIEAGKATLRPESFSVWKLMEEVSDLIRPALEKRGNRLEVRATDGVKSISADQTKVRQVLLNLLGNAIKFTQNGVITLTADLEPPVGEDEQHAISFQIMDTGVGMSHQQMERLFEAFYQVDPRDGSARRTTTGSGLGLAISRHLCRLMGGDIGVQSKLGTGTCFTVRLPVQIGIPNQELSV